MMWAGGLGTQKLFNLKILNDASQVHCRAKTCQLSPLPIGGLSGLEWSSEAICPCGIFAGLRVDFEMLLTLFNHSHLVKRKDNEVL